jgi:putative ABC transport system permease protein
MEEGIAKTLQLKLGDQLRFDMAGVVVRCARHLGSAGRLDVYAGQFLCHLSGFQAMPDIPMTYIAAYRAPTQTGFDNALVNRFPNITNVDMGATINQIQKVLGPGDWRGRVFVWRSRLAAGLVVLFAAVTATREERAREYAVLRALGAGNQLLRQVQTAELLGVGALSGALAAVVAVAMGWGLARYVFEFSLAQRRLGCLYAGYAVSGALLAWGAGWWGLREVLRRPVVETLRQAAQ